MNHSWIGSLSIVVSRKVAACILTTGIDMIATKLAVSRKIWALSKPIVTNRVFNLVGSRGIACLFRQVEGICQCLNDFAQRELGLQAKAFLSFPDSVHGRITADESFWPSTPHHAPALWAADPCSCKALRATPNTVVRCIDAVLA